MKDIDKIDMKILQLLCENARISHNQISNIVKLTKNTVTYRIQRLQKRKIIKGFATIINHKKIGFSSYEILIKTKVDKIKEEELLQYLINHNNTLVVDKFIGEWDFITEFGFKKIEDLYMVLDEIKYNFYDIIDNFEIHPVYQAYKTEQLAINIDNKKKVKPFDKHSAYYNKKTSERLNSFNLKLLYELSKDATAKIQTIAQNLNMSPETISKKIRELKNNEYILRFTAIINLENIGYKSYLIIIDLKNLSISRENKLKEYIIGHPMVEYSFMSATMPKVFVYFATKDANDLDKFLRETRELFSDIISNQKFCLSSSQHKYNMFPKGLL